MDSWGFGNNVSEFYITYTTKTVLNVPNMAWYRVSGSFGAAYTAGYKSSKYLFYNNTVLYVFKNMTGLNVAIEIYSTANPNSPILLNSLSYVSC
jgi:hypothetical protein